MRGQLIIHASMEVEIACELQVESFMNELKNCFFYTNALFYSSFKKIKSKRFV